MLYKEFLPNPLLREYVKCYWWFDNNNDRRLDYTILPDGCFDLIVSFVDRKQEWISLTGIWTKQVDVSISPNHQLFGIRFKPLAAENILDCTIAPFLDGALALPEDFWNIDKMSFSSLPPKAFDSVMISMLENARRRDPRKQSLFDLLYATNGGLTIKFYSRQTAWSRRQVNRYFNQQFGLSLKAYCNILKCAASYKYVTHGLLYPEDHYFDQSHFIKAIKKHTGYRPGDLYENKNDRFLQLTTIKET